MLQQTRRIKQTWLITAAGGNGTIVQVVNRALSPDACRARSLEHNQEIQEMFDMGAKQLCFFNPATGASTLAGSRGFCPNAAQAIALVSHHFSSQFQVPRYKVPGFSGRVSAHVTTREPNQYFVRCSFPGMRAIPTPARLKGMSALVVDLGWIVHIVIDGEIPAEYADYQRAHRGIVKQLSA